MQDKWCRHQDLNSGPTDYKSVALPAELYRHWIYQGMGFYVLKAFSAMFSFTNVSLFPTQEHRCLPAYSPVQAVQFQAVALIQRQLLQVGAVPDMAWRAA